MNKKVGFLSLGCKTNQYELQALKEAFARNGFYVVSFKEFAEVYIINTCIVTKESARKSKQMIRRAANKGAKVAVMGCMSQLYADEIAKMKNVIVVTGTSNRNEIVELVKKACILSHPFVVTEDKVDDIRIYEELKINHFSEQARAYVKIEDGCNNYCTYCIIPYSRGGSIRSRKAQDVIEEIERLVLNGYREIVLTGINICKYKDDNVGLIELLEKIDKIKGCFRLRLGSMYLDYLSDEIMDRLKSLDRLCHHFHMSIQSGSTGVLKKMGRSYRKEDIKYILEGLINRMPDFLFTADVIVGFPTESDLDFMDSVDIVRIFPFLHVHVFKYSKREGTKAAKMKDQIENAVKDRRSRELISVASENRKILYETLIGKSVEVVLEKIKDKDENIFYAHSRRYVPCLVKSNNGNEGELRTATIKKLEDEVLIAEIT